jgi:hypothetical protein
MRNIHYVVIRRLACPNAAFITKLGIETLLALEQVEMLFAFHDLANNTLILGS